jgi:hypothetical protein
MRPVERRYNPIPRLRSGIRVVIGRWQFALRPALECT